MKSLFHMRIIAGLIISVIGIIITIKSEWLYENMGAIPSAENWLGSSGGSRLAYKLIGVAATFIGFFMVTGLLGKFILWSLSPFFAGFK